jgi:acetylornithine deacetylase/succinyl-diaminopimelate desuccinylase-like protein
MRIAASCLLVLSICASPAGAQSTDIAAVRRIIDSAPFKSATAFLEQDHERFVRELITLTEIPAPPFKEKQRADAVLAMFKQLKLSDVEMDAEGNVMGLWRGSGPGARASGDGGAMVAVLAHLDTVFPEGTDVKVKRSGDRLSAPGVGDDTRGIALMLSIVRAMSAAGFSTSNDILFVANVGEEGEGDLRGTKYLLQKGKYKDRIKQFISIDGGDQSTITNGGVGSRRYRVTFKGPGGHSYGAFGLVNPAYAMGSAIAKFSRISVPQKPKTTFNVGAVGGGTSVNSIPFEVHMDVDIRSESCAELKKVDAQFLAIVRESVDEENKARSTREGKISADPKMIGDRPCGQTPVNSPIVQAVAAAVTAFGMTPNYSVSSTDANFPMSLGIPAVTIGRGPGERSHSLDEFTIVEPKADLRAAQVALAIVLAVAGVK